jgi:hypothetical protein
MEVSLADWCLQKWQEAVEAGSDKEAGNYQLLYQHWLDKESNDGRQKDT